MTGKRLLDYDQETGVSTWFHSTDDGFTLTTEQDCEDIIELNKTKQLAGRAYHAADNEMWRVASIPVVIQMKWLTEDGIDVMNRDHWPRVRAKLNDPDWRYLKTAEVII